MAKKEMEKKFFDIFKNIVGRRYLTELESGFSILIFDLKKKNYLCV